VSPALPVGALTRAGSVTELTVRPVPKATVLNESPISFASSPKLAVAA